MFEENIYEEIEEINNLSDYDNLFEMIYYMYSESKEKGYNIKFLMHSFINNEELKNTFNINDIYFRYKLEQKISYLTKEYK